jgi:phosphocarrier protein
MAERTVTIASASGLHARPAALFVKAAGAQPAVVTVTNAAGRSANARSMLAVLALGANRGDTVTLSAEGDGAEESVAALADLLTRDLDAAPA